MEYLYENKMNILSGWFSINKPDAPEEKNTSGASGLTY